MTRSTPPTTAGDRLRFHRIQDLGCLACLIHCDSYREPQIHHLTIDGRHGRKRRGHQYTIGLCPWHHQGQPIAGLTSHETAALLGPSLALTPRRFRLRFGEDALLLQDQNERLRAAVQRVTPADNL